MRIDRKAHLIFVLIVGLVFVAGCWDRREMDEIALVMASGVDITDDGQLELSVQIALPTAIPGTLQTGGTDKKPVQVISVKGRAGLEVFALLQQQLSRQLFLGHRAVIVFGEKFAKAGIDQALDVLIRMPDSRYNSYVLTSYGTTAKELLNAPYRMEVIPAIGMKNIEAAKYSVAVKVDEFISDLSTVGKMPVTGAARLFEDAAGDKTFQIDKAAVYRGNKLAGFLSGKYLKGYKLMSGQAKGMKIAVQVEPVREKTKGIVTVEILRAKTKVLTHWEKDTPRVTVSFEATSRALANESSLDLSKANHVRRLETELTDKLRETISDMIAKTQREYRSDILGFGREFHIQHAKEWKKLKGQWDELYPEIPVAVAAEMKIERIGRIQAPGPLSKEEVQ